MIGKDKHNVGLDVERKAFGGCAVGVGSRLKLGDQDNQVMKFVSGRRARSPLDKLAMSAVAGAVVALVASCGVLQGNSNPGDDESTRDNSGVITEGGEVGVNVLQLGDCFDDIQSDEVTDILAVDAVPCAEPHDNEVYYLGALPEADFPGENLVEELVVDQCITVFEAFAGIAYTESMLEIGYIFPSEGSWNEGDRGYICTVYNVSLDKLEGSMRGRGY